MFSFWWTGGGPLKLMANDGPCAAAYVA